MSSTTSDSEKPYELTFEDRQEYLYAAVTSDQERSRYATGDYISEIARVCRRMGCVRLLIDKIVPNTLWLWDSMFVLNFFPKLGLRDIKVAIVDESAKIFDPQGFAVEMGVSPGVDMHVLSDRDAAEQWLLSS